METRKEAALTGRLQPTSKCHRLQPVVNGLLTDTEPGFSRLGPTGETQARLKPAQHVRYRAAIHQLKLAAGTDRLKLVS